LAARSLAAAELDPSQSPVKASLITETKGFSPGQVLTVALRLQQQTGWHTYWRDPGDAGLATSVQWKLPPGLKVGPLLWPKPLTFKDPGGLVGYGYLGQAVLLAEIKIPAGFHGDKLLLQAQANWLSCREVCIPGDAGVSLVLPRLEPNAASANAPLFEQLRPTLGLLPDGYKGSVQAAAPSPGKPPRTRVDEAALNDFEDPGSEGAAPAAAGFLFILFSGFVGGLLLNLMPCVLPVLSLKAISFVEQAKESRAQGLKLAAAFSAGVLFSFWALAAVVVALKHGGQAVGWGFQFQEPAFVFFMAALVLAFALNLFGVFEIWLPGEAMQGLSQASYQQGLTGAFGHGLVMTLLATPCSAPFLGTALGFAFTASAMHLFMVFTAVGLGLALPYALLASLPAAHAWLPKPGPWMVRFKDVMGFLLLATLVWLLWLLGKQVGVDALAFGLIWLLILAFAAWAWGAWGGLQHSGTQRLWLGAGLLALLGLSGVWALPKAVTPEAPAGHGVAADGWLAWDQAEVERLHKQGKPVFVDFSADWCWTCKVNEKAVLDRQEVKDAFAHASIVLMRADWTRHDSAITAALREQGRGGVPMYIYYPAQGPAHLFPELLTRKMVLDVLKQDGRG
jgi:thiol:disulfide interchange protein DsbD